MGYQALLFCPEEKLARVVNQVFTELDFTVELVQEPFAAVKKLMSQRYDAIVVDCENEQNASLLFKSARNSSSNQSSLAIAVVEGQTGVAKAYRIGANLVLTKPINVEQAKGTLRVARGLLRKNSDAVANAAAASPGAKPTSTPVPVTAATEPVHLELRNAAAVVLPAVHAAVPAGSPATSASMSDSVPAVAPSAPASIAVSEFSAMAASGKTPETKLDGERSDSSHYLRSGPSAKADVNESSKFVTGAGTAAATAPAKEAQAASHPAIQHQLVQHSAIQLEFLTPASVEGREADAGSSFSATRLSATSDSLSLSLSGYDEPASSGGSKKIIIAAIVILGLAALGYFGYTNLGKNTAAPTNQNSGLSTAATPPATAPPQSSPNAAAQASPGSSSGKTSAVKISIASAAAKPSAHPSDIHESGLDSSARDSATHDSAKYEQETKAPSVAPVHVKSIVPAKRNSSEDVAAPPVSALASASSPDSGLNSVMASSTPNLPRPALAALKVSQGVSQGLLIKRVQPKYPQSALAVHTQGTVQIEATINKEGNVVNPKVLHGDAILAHAALEAVRQWRYKPYYLDGEPVEIQTEISITFKAN
jgi:TonB family protein